MGGSTKLASLVLISLAWGFATLRAEASSQAPTSVVLNGISCAVDSVITRDYTIVGGGSSGTFAAIQLSDLGNTVAVVEEKGLLGGHTNTYTDPATGNTIDYGVVVFHNLTVVKNYFARLNVSLVASPLTSTGETYNVDFRTGAIVANFTAANPASALALYGAQLSKYPYVDQGFDLPYPVPSDLLLPFGDFVKKYGLEDLVQFMFNFAQGLGDLLAQPTLYVFKNFGSDLLKALQTGLLTTQLEDNHLIYDHAQDELGENVFLNSTVVAVDRSSNDGVKVLLQTPSGRVLIESKKIILTIPPQLWNLQGWDLSQSEKTLFQQFGNSAYYTGLLKNTGIPANASSVHNIRADTLYNIPELPGVYGLKQTNTPGLLNVKFGSAYGLPDSQVQAAIISGVKRLQIPGIEDAEPELVAYSSHTPFELTVPASAIAGGFYKNLIALQGQRHTFYTGGAFHTYDSSLLWQFTEALLPNITA